MAARSPGLGRVRVIARVGHADAGCGHGASVPCAVRAVRPLLAAGTPEDVAIVLVPFVEAGCRTFNLIPAGDDLVAVVDAAAEVRRLLNE